MAIYYEDVIANVRNVTEEEIYAVKVMEYREFPEVNKNIRDYVELAARAYAKQALYSLCLELKRYAFETNRKHFSFEILVAGVDYIKACEGIETTGINYIIPFTLESKFALNTPTIQNCIFNGIYGEQAKNAYIQKMRELLERFGELRTVGDIFSVYSRIVFCH